MQRTWIQAEEEIRMCYSRFQSPTKRQHYTIIYYDIAEKNPFIVLNIRAEAKALLASRTKHLAALQWHVRSLRCPVLHTSRMQFRFPNQARLKLFCLPKQRLYSPLP